MATLINPPGSEDTYEHWHFSQAVQHGDQVWVSGQVGLGPDGAPDDLAGQARLAFQSLERVLGAAGATLKDVVELVTYHVDMDLRSFGKVKDEFFPKDYPAWTAVGVTALALPALKVEIRATAIVGSGQSR
ncbi:MAG: RidA family protein [Myxococcota bacterium]